ncbi:MAG: hypothetical protein ACFFB2_00435 [Promethearchaeota archaeon]
MELISDDFKSETLSLNSIPELMESPFDYLRAVFIYFWNQSDSLPSSTLLPSRITIKSDIPIGAGLSSSAALLTSMVYFISNILLDQELDLKNIAEIAYICEHDIMGISCGRMDQYSCALGKIFHMTSKFRPNIIPLQLPQNTYIIIADSGIKRKADIPLKNVQESIFRALEDLNNPNLNELNEDDIKSSKLTRLQQKRLTGVIGIRDNTMAALKELQRKNLNLMAIGKLLSEQQTFLRENYQVSLPKLDLMCKIALQNGAFGAKMTGAGFGGCIFAISDKQKRAIQIKNNLQRVGASYIMKMDTKGILHKSGT